MPNQRRKIVLWGQLAKYKLEISEDLWELACWFEDGTASGNTYVSPAYPNLLGGVCLDHDWVHHVLNPEYVSTYLDWRKGEDEFWDHSLAWRFPDGQVKTFHSFARRFETGAIQGVVSEHRFFRFPNDDRPRQRRNGKTQTL